MMQKIIMVGIVAVVLIVGITVYLSPDDLATCQKPIGAEQCRAADAIVVVSGGDTTARTQEAIHLYQSGWAPLIIVSGAAADKTGLSNAEAMKRQAIANGVLEEAIVIEERSETTKQNASEVAAIIQQRAIKDIIVVTSGYHMRRATLEFSASNPGVQVRSHPVAADSQWNIWWWLTPWGWWLSGSELIKVLVFYLGGSR